MIDTVHFSPLLSDLVRRTPITRRVERVPVAGRALIRALAFTKRFWEVRNRNIIMFCNIRIKFVTARTRVFVVGGPLGRETHKVGSIGRER